MVPTSTTLKVVTVKFTSLFSPMFGTTCWTTGAEVTLSTIPDGQICTITHFITNCSEIYSNLRWQVPSTSS